MFDFMQNGPLMDEAGDAGGGGGIGIADTGAESTALVTTGDTSLATTDDTGADDDTGGELTTTTEQVLENGRPSKSTSAALQTIRATNPQLAKAVPQALATQARLRSMFPNQNPFAAIQSMQRTLKSIGGEEGLAQIRQSLADMEEMDLLYAGGDPRMLEKMTQTPEGKAAFAKLAPHAFSLYQKLAPNSFTRYMANVILGDLLGERVDMVLSRIAELTPKELTAADGSKVPNPVVNELAKVDKYLQRLQDFEKLKPEFSEVATADTGRDELDRERQNLEIEKKKIVVQGWRNAADAEKSKIFNQAWTLETKGRKITAIDREDIVSRFWTRLPIALKNVPGFSDTLKEYFETNDRDGYLRYLQSLHAHHMPRILRAEIQRRYGASKAAATTTTTETAKTTQVADGFKRVGTAPHMNEVNARLTTPDMWKRRQAALKTGGKVQW